MDIFSDDGSLRGVYYRKASGNRPAVVCIDLRGDVAGRGACSKPLHTLFSLDKDFFAAWSKVVASLCTYYGVDRDSALGASMWLSHEIFISNQKLLLRTVSYQQAYKAEEEPQ